MKRRIGAVVALGLFGAPTGVLGQPTAKAAHAPESTEHSTSVQPVLRTTARLFKALDVDGDGAVTHAELSRVVAQHVAERVRARFAQLDRDADGRVTRLETMGMKPARFGRFDVDGNGAFTVEELRRVMQSQAAERTVQLLASLDVDGDRRFTALELNLHRQAIAVARRERGEQRSATETASASSSTAGAVRAQNTGRKDRAAF